MNSSKLEGYENCKEAAPRIISELILTGTSTVSLAFALIEEDSTRLRANCLSSPGTNEALTSPVACPSKLTIASSVRSATSSDEGKNTQSAFAKAVIWFTYLLIISRASVLLTLPLFVTSPASTCKVSRVLSSRK